MSNRAAGLLLASLLAICAFLGWRIWLLTQDELVSDNLSAPTTTEPDASRAFLAAWRADEQASYIAFATSGLVGNGISASTEDIIVRHEGELLINRDNSIIYQRDGESETCRQTTNELFCTPPVVVGTYDERAEVVASLMTGPDARYSVTYSDNVGCFDLALDLSKGSITDDFGLFSEFCFDPATNALLSRSVERVNRTESFEVSDISDVVEENDLRGVFPEAILDRFFQ